LIEEKNMSEQRKQQIAETVEKAERGDDS